MQYERNPVLTHFYNSKAWRRARDAYAASRGYICEICGNKNADPTIRPFMKQFHVHHKIELTEENVADPDIALNEKNFMLLCLHCHNAARKQREVLAPGLEFDENGMVRKINGSGKKGDTA